MKKDIRDYLQYHIGCQCMVRTITSEWQIKELTYDLAKAIVQVGADHPDYFQYVLRAIEDLSFKEFNEFLEHGSIASREILSIKRETKTLLNVEYDRKGKPDNYFVSLSMYTPEQMKFLLKAGVDVFDLIDEGLAIRKSK